jgi:hypothetical protein
MLLLCWGLASTGGTLDGVRQRFRQSEVVQTFFNRQFLASGLFQWQRQAQKCFFLGSFVAAFLADEDRS